MPTQPEYILTVDEKDNIIGTEEKNKCHDGKGILHRAFMAIVLNSKNELLLTRRSQKKRLWPGFWDGSIASHVHDGESYEAAAKNRLLQELGVKCQDVKHLFKIKYYAPFKNLGSENEICAALLTKGIDSIFPNKKEISDYKFVSMDEIKKDIKENSKKYTPWFLLIFDKFVDMQKTNQI